MNSAEMKIDLFRQIDSLSEKDLEILYKNFKTFFIRSTQHRLSQNERQAIKEALEAGKKESGFTYEEIVSEAKQKYTNLNF